MRQTAVWRRADTAVRDGDYSASYDTHIERVHRLGSALARSLSSPQDRFAVLSLNSHEFLELWHAAMFGAGVITPINYRLAPKEIAFILSDSGASVIFVDADNRDLWDEVAALGSHPRVVGIGWSAEDVTEFDEFLSAGEGVSIPEPEEDDLLGLMYTGGTTGTPKGVMISHRAAMLNAYHQIEVLRPTSTSVYLHQSPMFHAAAMYGLMAPSLAGGVQCTLPKFTPSLLVGTVERYGVTETQMGPTMIGMLFDECGDQLDRIASLRNMIYGSAPMPRGTLDRVLTELPDLQLFHGYGMTESSSAVSYMRHDELLADPALLSSAGRPLIGVNVSIQDPSGAHLPPGEKGEICARGGNFMAGYWNRPAETADVLRDGWYRTGDLGYLNDKGYLFVVDRIKDMVLSGGENIYSSEVENAISTHPAVAQVAVIGVPHEKWGEQVHAVVVRRDGAHVTEADLAAHARSQIAGYKVPKSWDIRLEPLPVSGAMKILKRDLRAPYWDEG